MLLIYMFAYRGHVHLSHCEHFDVIFDCPEIRNNIFTQLELI